MDLRTSLARWGLARPHVLLVAPDAEPRWHVEALLQQRGWPRAFSPADTDLLVVVGDIGPELARAVDLLWSQVPRPRRRVHLPGTIADGRELDAAMLGLLASAADRTPDADEGDEDNGEDAGHGAHDTGEDASHGAHDMGDVAGLPMAGTSPDRDGLELDALTVSLGPVLPGWPTGLVLSGSLQGDVLTEAAAAVLGPVAARPEADALLALDALERFLVVAGPATAARDAASVRTDLFRAAQGSGAIGAPVLRRGRHLLRRVRTSRTLRWGSGDLRGALDRVYAWCDVVQGGLDGDSTGPGNTVPAPAGRTLVAVDDLPDMVNGLDLGSVRLVVASLDIDLAGARAQVPGG